MNLNNCIYKFDSFKNFSADHINKIVDDYSLCIIKNFVDLKICNKIVSHFENTLDTSNDKPTIGESPSDIKKIYQKLSIGGYMNGWDYRPRYARVIYSPFWEEDIFGIHKVSKEFCKLRNIVQGYAPNFAIDQIQDDLWTALRIQHYPSGGGFFSAHRDVVLDETTSSAGIKQFNQFLLLLTSKDTHFTKGGAFVYNGNDKIDIENVAKGGDVIIYNGTNIHGVDDIDPQITANTNAKTGRIVILASLYKNILDKNDYKKK